MAAEPGRLREDKIDSQQLHCFLTLAEELNFGRAAQSLGVSQSKVSGQIKKLEDELGVRLFERTTRQVRLTAAGIKVLPHARSIVSQVKQVSLVARTNSALETPKIVVGDNAQAYADGSVRSLVANLPEDLTSHLELRPKPHKGWVNGLIDGNADIGFFNEPPKGQSELRFEIAAVIPLVCAMSHDHDLSQLNVITPECFIGQNLIIPTQDRIGATKQAIQRRIEAQLHDIDVIEADQDWATILAMIECNIGVGLVPKTLAKANNETLRFVQFDDRPLNLAHYLAVVSRKWWKLFHGVSERLIVWLCYAARSRISLSG